MLSLAQDRRTVDQDGRLHIPDCRISKANVCPYMGREIPEWEGLGLNPDRVYMMYRDPKALAEAAATFENVPLMVDHVPISADDPALEQVGGTVSNARFEYPYLVADVTAWTREAIDGIESEERKELSCAYRYVASMISGTSPDGVRYDGQMVGPIKANHVALVAKGRAGPDVVVADSAEAPIMKRPKIMSAIAAILGAIAKPEQLVALDSAMDEEIDKGATDEFPDLDDTEKKAARDCAMADLGKDSLTDEEETEAYKRAAKDKKAKDEAPAPPEGGAPKPAQDAAVQLAVDAAVTLATKDMISKTAATQMAADARAEVLALFAAREAVAPKVGVVALDTAEAVYRFAMDKAGIAHKDVPAAALASLYDAAIAATKPIAQDSGVTTPKVTDLFPGLRNIRRS